MRKKEPRHFRHLASINIQLLAAGAVLAIVGVAFIQFSSAATFAASQEAELGTRQGNSTTVSGADATGASGTSAIRFGAPATALPPYFAKAITGGTSIAVVWRASPGPVAKYEVYRNDAMVGTVTPGAGVTLMETQGRTYVDKSVAPGTSYSYKVRTVAPDGSISGFTSAGTVTHPRTTTPVPTININLSAGGSELADKLNNQVKPYLEIWYPKVSDALAFPDYTPTTTINIVSEPTLDAAARANWQSSTIRFKPTSTLVNSPEANNVFLHEATHLITQRSVEPDLPVWLQEGLADWPINWLTLDRTYTPQSSNTLSEAYEQGAATLQWLERKYSSGIVRKLQIAAKNKTYSDSMISGVAGGKTPQQVHDEMKAQYFGPTGPLKHSSGLCAEIPTASTTDGTLLQLAACNGGAAQSWQKVYTYGGLETSNKSLFRLANPAVQTNGRCAIMYNTTNPPKIATWHCTPTYAAYNTYSFMAGPGNALRTPSTNKCVTTTTAATAAGDTLQTGTCDLSGRQSWTLP